MSLQKNFDVFIIGELEIRRFDFFFFPLEKLRGAQSWAAAGTGCVSRPVACCRPPCSLPFSSQFFSSFFWCVCNLLFWEDILSRISVIYLTVYSY